MNSNYFKFKKTLAYSYTYVIVYAAIASKHQFVGVILTAKKGLSRQKNYLYKQP